MENVTAPKVGVAKPLTAAPAAAPVTTTTAPAVAAPAAPAPVTDEKSVNVGKVGLDSAARTTGLTKDVPEVDFSAVEPAKAEAPMAEEGSFFSRAMGLFGNALSYSARAVVSPITLAADLGWVDKVKEWFTGDGSDTLAELAKSGKLSAIDKNLTTLKGVIDKLIKSGVDPKLIEILNRHAADPGSIEQLPGKETCQAAVFQMKLAEANPGAYAKAAQELYEKGTTTLPDGTKISISEANRKWLEKQKMGLETMINAVFQVAIAEAVNAPGHYDVATDKVTEDITIFGATVATTVEAGADFEAIVKFFQDQKMALFDPRTAASANRPAQAAALKAAFEAAKANGQGLSVPIHAPAGAESDYHMVEVSNIDDKGNVTVVDPDTGKETVYGKEEFQKMVGWDITAYSNVGGGRGTQSGGGGSGTV